MAELYLADYLREDGFRRRVAVKRILPHFAADEDFVHMFIREARLAALLQHPNIVQVFDYGHISDVSFIAMEYIDGTNLRRSCRPAPRATSQFPIERGRPSSPRRPVQGPRVCTQKNDHHGGR